MFAFGLNLVQHVFMCGLLQVDLLEKTFVTAEKQNVES